MQLIDESDTHVTNLDNGSDMPARLDAKLDRVQFPYRDSGNTPAPHTVDKSVPIQISRGDSQWRQSILT
jgi:hypothetical protein